MNVAIGLKAHSGWAALVVVGKRDGGFVVVDRHRLELVEEEWAKQPYHSARKVAPDAAPNVVRRCVESAGRIAIREMRAVVRREEGRGNIVTACALLATDAMPDWSIEEILAVHVRMHKAEGALFRNVLARAGEACGLRLVTIPEKLLARDVQQISALGKVDGPPWGKDQKDAALAALVALQQPGSAPGDAE